MAATRWALAVVLLVSAAACASGTSEVQSTTAAAGAAEVIPGSAAAPGEKGGLDLTGPYEVVPNWPDPTMCGEGFQGGSVAGVWAETPDRIYVFQRGCLPAIEQASDVGALQLNS